MHLVSDTGGSDDGTDRETASDSSDTETGTFDTTIPRSVSLTTAWDESFANPFAPLLTAADPVTFFARESARPRLDVIEDDLPILAQRAAFLRFGGDSRHWMSVTSDCAFSADEDAECKATFTTWGRSASKPTHKVPHPECTCGFYACPLGVPLQYAAPLTVTLLVELSGDVIECERLYRAEHQRVIECQLPRCPYCGSEAGVLRAKSGQLAAVACSERHLERSRGVTLAVDDIAELVGVPVTSKPYT